MRWTSVFAVAGAVVAFFPVFAQAQSVTPPQFDAPTLRAKLAPAMAPAGRAMPGDVANLNALLSQKSYLALRQRLQATNQASDVLLDMNWEQEHIYNGANFLIPLIYSFDAWRLGSALKTPEGEELKKTAASFLLYSLSIAIVDGPKCADASAPGHRIDQLVSNNRQILQYLMALPRADRMTLGSLAVGVEAATAPVRSDDEVLCSGGAAEITHDLAVNGNKPLQPVPNASGVVGKSYEVPADPAFHPAFVSADQWGPKQAQARQTLPATLTRMLTPPNEAAPTPSAK